MIKSDLQPTRHVCPWWYAYTFDNALRRWLQRPEKLLAPYIESGMTVLDIGCGMGVFSIPLARMVGPKGRVIAADLQPQMLRVLTTRARRALPEELFIVIHPHQCQSESIGYSGVVDFALAFNMVHETPDSQQFLQQIFALLKSGSRFFVAEPLFHVTPEQINETIASAGKAGFELLDRPRVRFSHAMVFRRP